ncbi:MAG: patatin-like phospholipase family protein [Patescibacteria group bacterium]|jgi:NTE family protein|nr:patatin-like phospholipase family protein [Patescibacteria group bacterium]
MSKEPTILESDRQKSKVLVELHNQPRPLVALSLGGGGAKTFAHLGVIDALEQHNIPIDFLVTCSAASVVGILHNIGVSSEEIMKEFKRKRKWFRIFRGSLFKEILKKYLKQNDISDIKQAKRPMSIVTVDLKTGREVIFEQGDPLIVPLASSAFPGIWRPFKFQDYELIDGGVLNPDPADIARTKVGAKGIVISVSLKMEFVQESNRNRFNTILKSLYLSSLKLRSKIIEDNSDIVISPANDLKINFRDWRETFFGYFSNAKIDYYYRKGYDEANSKIPRIKELFNG